MTLFKLYHIGEAMSIDFGYICELVIEVKKKRAADYSAAPKIV